MFRRTEASIPPDFKFPTDLEGLGYFINENDQIRMIDDPEEPFNYKASKNDRFVEMQKEAMSQCTRRLIYDRLNNLKVGASPLPPTAGRDEPHVPILASENINQADRIIVYIGESHQDLGMLAGRLMHDTLNLGTLVNLAYDVLVDPSSPEAEATIQAKGHKKLENFSKTALVVANPGQLIWWRRGKKALTYQSWQAVPRKWGPGDGPLMSEKNRIPRNADRTEHLQCLFDDFLSPFAQTGIKIDVIGAGDAMESLVRILDSGWDKWKGTVEAIVCASAYIYPQDFSNEDFQTFWSDRARVYIPSETPMDTPMTGREELGCNVYSSGEAFFAECIVPRSYKTMLDYFKLVHANPTYKNTPQETPEQIEQPDNSWGIGGEEIVDEEASESDVNIDVQLGDGDDEDAAIDKAIAEGLGKAADAA